MGIKLLHRLIVVEIQVNKLRSNSIADSEEKSTVRFKLRMARKILKKAQDKLRNVSSTFSFIMSDEFRAKL